MNQMSISLNVAQFSIT